MKQNKNCKTSRWHVRQTSKAEKVSYKNTKRVSSMQSIYLSQCFSFSLFISSFFGLSFFKLCFIECFFPLFYFAVRSVNILYKKFPYASQKLRRSRQKLVYVNKQKSVGLTDGIFACYI